MASNSVDYHLSRGYTTSARYLIFDITSTIRGKTRITLLCTDCTSNIASKSRILAISSTLRSKWAISLAFLISVLGPGMLFLVRAMCHLANGKGFGCLT